MGSNVLIAVDIQNIKKKRANHSGRMSSGQKPIF